MAKKFNPKEQYCEVWGDEEGRVYQQGGAYFDGQGNEWQPGAPKPDVVATPKVVPKAPTAADSQIEKQLAAK